VDSRVETCGDEFGVIVDGGDAATITCGSLTAAVSAGELEIEIPDGRRLVVRAPAAVHVAEDAAEGIWRVEQLAGDPADVTVIESAPPSASIDAPGVVAVGSSFVADASGSSDPDGDGLEHRWSFAGQVASGPVVGLVAPDAPGIYPLVLEVVDPSGATDEQRLDIVVYDPSGQGVSGGGWFLSPAGALVDQSEASGRAHVAFHASYRRGRTTPDGNVGMRFDGGGLVLRSSEFEWLVANDSRARFRGTGTLEGRSSQVTFDVIATEPSTIRIRIWDDTGLLYDSGDVELEGGRVVLTGR
jgi:hypothetical protein